MLLSRKRTWLMSVAITGLGLVATAALACGGDDGGSPRPTSASGIVYRDLDGPVRIDGSTTVYPISEAVAEEFSKAARGVRANVGFSGTGGGFEKFCRGEIDIANASRPMRDSEKQACAKEGRTRIVELQVAIDALTVVVHPDNDWATCMTPEQLNLAFRDGGAEKWSDLDPSWPSDDIDVYYPGADSGTFDYFVEAIVEGSAPEGEEPSHRSDGTSSEDDNVLVQGVEGSKNAIGYFGFAYYQEAGSHLTAVAIDDGEGCIEPTFDNALGGKYTPLSRPLFIYTDASILQEKDQVLGFVQFYIETMNELSEEVGYIRLPEELTQEQQQNIAEFLPR